MKTKVRSLSQNELMYLDLQELSNTFTIQYLLAYKKVNMTWVQESFERTVREIPSIWVYKKGNNWVCNTVRPKVEELWIKETNVLDEPILKSKLDVCKQSITCTVLHAQNQDYLLIRFSHSLVDGQGALLFLNHFFRIMSTRQIPDNTCNDESFVRGLPLQSGKLKFGKYNPRNPIALDKNFVWRDIVLNGYHVGVIARLARILAQYFRQDSIKFLIPTDIRRHKPSSDLYFANLTLPIFLNASPKEDWQNINGKLLYALKEKQELCAANVRHYHYGLIPHKMRVWGWEKLIKRSQERNRFLIGGIISHLGRISLDKYLIEQQVPMQFVSLPVAQPLGIFSVVITEYNRRTHICISYPKNLFNFQEERLFLLGVRQEFEGYSSMLQGPEQEWSVTCVQSLETIARESAQKIAIVTETKKYTYADLLEASSHIATGLKQAGVKAQDKVNICLGRSFEMVASMWAVMRIGGIWHLVAEAEVTANTKNFTINSANISRLLAFPAKGDIFYKYSGEDILYEVSTSGSTGCPKRIRVTVENFSNYIFWAAQTYTAQKNVVMPLFTDLRVDLTYTSLFLPFITAGTLKIFSESFTPMILKQIYSDPDINLVKCTPSHLTFWDKEMLTCTKLKGLIVGGEDFSVSLAKRLWNQHAFIVNEYGPAETTVGSSYHFLRKEDLKREKIPIGQPICNTAIKIQTATLGNPGVGEIVIQGKGVTSGYANGLEDGFLQQKGKVIEYHTGDQGYILQNQLFFSGRSDGQIKIHGHRIEREHISAVLKKFSNVKDAYVFYTRKHLSAVICTNVKIDIKDLKSFLRPTLPDYARPQHFIFVENVPIGANGKADMNYMESIVDSYLSVSKEPQSPIERLIQSILKDKSLKMGANCLYDMGVDSVDCIKILMNLSRGVTPAKRDDFIHNLMPKIQGMSVSELEKILSNYEWKAN